MVGTSPGFDPSVPGFTAQRISSESAVLFQSFFLGDVVYDGLQVVDSTAVDSGNSPTSILRPGLVMAKLDATGAWVNYDPTATNGAQEARGVLVQEVNLIDYTTGSAATRMFGAIVIGGKGKAAAWIGLDQQARNQLSRRGFMFDDDGWFPVTQTRRRVTKAANYTLTAADHATLFQQITGAVVFTLPALASNVGFAAEFLCTSDFSTQIASAEGTNILVDGNASASSITFNTASHRIGGRVLVEAMYVSGTLKWVVTNKSGPGNVITIA